MKKLLAVALLVTFGFCSYGQVSIDTVQALLLVGDTAYVPELKKSYDADGNLVVEKSYQTKQGLCWWERGYAVGVKIYDLGITTRSNEYYLDSNKNPFPKNIVIFLSK
jgi:hypothetical protein